ncbi:hypothetical protein BC830DRAFT_1070421 [Chytriomyces sp. MP71]|nr:hypothetical protein BC830DRAFT_1070421 [Chytriomyces sp. MP71]
MRFKFHSFGAESLSSRTFEPLPLNRHNLQARLRLAPFWLDVLNPSAEEMSALARVFKLHPLTMEDILTGTREKCETFPGYSFVSFTTFEADEESAGFLQAIPVYMVIFRECLLSFHMKPMTHMQHVLRRVEQLSLSGPQLSPDWLNYALIDNVIDAFMPLIEHIEQEVEAIDDLVLVLKGNEQSDMLRRISTARKRVNQLLRLLAPKTDTIRALIKRCSTRLSRESDIILYLEDVQDHIITMNLNLTHCEKTLMRTHSNYLADISIAITNSSNQTNDIVLKMTTIASLLVPLNLITGLWGMNVPVPGRDEEGLTWFFSLVTAMVVIALSAYLVARKYKIF